MKAQKHLLDSFCRELCMKSFCLRFWICSIRAVSKETFLLLPAQIFGVLELRALLRKSFKVSVKQAIQCKALFGNTIWTYVDDWAYFGIEKKDVSVIKDLKRRQIVWAIMPRWMLSFKKPHGNQDEFDKACRRRSGFRLKVDSRFYYGDFTSL